MSGIYQSPTNESEIVAVFRDARDRFLTGLTEEEKRRFQEFSSANDMITKLKHETQSHNVNKSPIARCALQIERFGARIAPFFDIIGVFVQSHPEYASLIWGSLLLIFKLGSHCATFLQNVCDTLEDMSRSLPAYEKVLQHVREMTDRTRILLLFLEVYCDLLEFCAAVRKILEPLEGFRAQNRLAFRLSWKPFHIRFGDILGKFKRHTDALDLELKISHQIATMEQKEVSKRQMEKLSKLPNQDDLNALSRELQNMKVDIQFNTAKLDTVYKSIQDSRKEASTLQQLKENMISDEQKKNVAKLIESTKRWTNPPVWKDLFEKRNFQWQCGTSEWFFSDPTLTQWFHDIYLSWYHDVRSVRPILLVKAKPGYGKTVLCTKFIDHFLEPNESVPNPLLIPKSDVTYHYYDIEFEKSGQTRADGAFRTGLAQIIHAEQDHLDESALDAMSMLTCKKGSGQLIGSAEEIIGLLQWFCRQKPRRLMVIDAVDEADNIPWFFNLLQKIFRNDQTSSSTSMSPAEPNIVPAMVMFTRPNISVPPQVAELCQDLLLDESLNRRDIEEYFRARFEGLVDDTRLNEISRNAAMHAEGMFLWAHLLVELISKKTFFEDERLEILQNLDRLEGLETLFTKILGELGKHSTRAYERLQVLFTWTAYAARPLHVEELHEVLAKQVPSDWSLTMSTEKFREIISKISGALLEVTRMSTVQFIHSSVRGYLQDCAKERSARHPFKLERYPSYLGIAEFCLSYLTQVVHAGPLGYDNPRSLGNDFPLLRFVMNEWQRHVCTFLHTQLHSSSRTESRIFIEDTKKLLKDMLTFLTNKSRFQTWVEASWIFRVPPTVDELFLCLKIPRGNFGQSELSDVRHFRTFLEYCAKELHRLNSSWGGILRKTPSEIWEPSILAFEKSDLLPKTTDSSASAFESEKRSAYTSISLESKVSSDCSEVGLLKLIIPRCVWSHLPLQSQDQTKLLRILVSNALTFAQRFVYLRIEGGEYETSNKRSQGWRASFEVWSLISQRLKFKVDFDISKDDAEPLVYELSRTELRLDEPLVYEVQQPKIRCPMAISNDLRKVIVVTSLVKITEVGEGVKMENSRGCKYEKTLLQPWKASTRPYGMVFSFDNNALFFMRPGSSVRVAFGTEQQIWPSESRSIAIPPEQLGLPQDDLHQLARYVKFHPNMSAVAFTCGQTTRLWHYGNPNSLLVTIVDVPLERLQFSDSGSFMYAFHSKQSRMEPVFVNLTPFALPLLVAEEAQSHDRSSNKARGIIQPLTTGQFRDCVSADTPALWEPEMISIRKDADGAISMSVLRHFRQDGAVVFVKLREDGTFSSETLTRLPSDLDLSEAILINTPDQDPETTRLVVNVKQQEKYDLSSGGRPQMPVFVKRRSASIPKTEGKVGRMISFEGG